MNATLRKQASAELVGTFLIVLFGCGSVCSSKSGAWVGVWQVAVCWGFGVSLAIYSTAEISGAHLNPAVSLAFKLVRPETIDTKKCLVFMVAQLMGAMIGGFVNLALFNSTLVAFERANDITRGDPKSILSAMAFGEYFPNPELNAKYTSDGVFEDKDVTVLAAMFTELWGTLILTFVIFALTHKKNCVLGKYERVGVPFMIGCTVACLLGLYAPITQAGWNPARDFGPRIAAACGGWGTVAIPGPRNGFWIYIIGPFVGGPIGAFLADMVVHGDRLWGGIGEEKTKKSDQELSIAHGCVCVPSDKLDKIEGSLALLRQGNLCSSDSAL